MAWTIRMAEPGDLKGLNELFTTVFGTTRSLVHDRWKFQTNPHGKHLSAIAVDGDRIVGQYALWPVRLHVGSEEILGAQSLDTMTHPDYRKQGMAVALATAVMNEAVGMGVEAMYGFPQENSYPPLVYNLNWDHVGDIHRWVRPLRISANPRVPTAAGWVVEAAMKLWPGRRDGEVRFEAGPPSDDELSAIYAGWNHPKGTCRVTRDPGWMRWRTAPESGHDYQWVRAYRKDQFVGFTLWGSSRAGAICNVMDVRGSTDADLDIVLAEAVRCAHASRGTVMTLVDTDPRICRAARRAGFVRYGKLTFVTRSMTSRVLKGNIHRMASWQISGIDLDTQ